MNSGLIQCVVVLYKCSFRDSTTIRSLAECFLEGNEIAKRLSILVYDNSPLAQPWEETFLPGWPIEYQHAAENRGLPDAYNQALSVAQQKGIEWLLLLDQDTVLDANFLHALFAATGRPPQPEVCAIIPKLFREGTRLSPQWVALFRNRPLARGFSGISRKTVTAMNSAACLRVQAVLSIGGFPQKYWLDYLDHVVFHRLQAAGGKVLILDIVMEHRLSLRNLEAEMSLPRFANFLNAEWMFVRETHSGGGPTIHRLRLALRALSYAIRMRNNAYARQTVRAVFDRS